MSTIYFLKEVFDHVHFNDPVSIVDVVLDDSVSISIVKSLKFSKIFILIAIKLNIDRFLKCLCRERENSTEIRSFGI